MLLRLDMSPSEGSKVVLLVGEIVHANAEWDALSALGELRVRQELIWSSPTAARLLFWSALSILLVDTDRSISLQQVNDGDREQFLNDCRSGLHDGTLAIARTYDSVKVRCAKSPLAATCTAAISSIGRANNASS